MNGTPDRDETLPLILQVDDVLSAVLAHPALRLILWGILAGLVSMMLYKWLSPQERIASLKQRGREILKELVRYNEEQMAGLWKLTGRSMLNSFQQIGLMLLPVIVASIPMLWLMFSLSLRYDYRLPEAGDSIEVSVSPADAEVSWKPFLNTLPQHEENQWKITWPETGKSLRLYDKAERELLVLPLTLPVQTVHKYSAWNILFDNPAGYIPGESPVEVVELKLPDHEVLTSGPRWVRSWWFTFLLSLVLSSLLAKRMFKIQ